MVRQGRPAAEASPRRRQPEQPLSQHAAVVEAINRIFLEALTCETEEQLGAFCLTVAEELTGSKFGFIGEINADGRLDDIAISDPGWDACRMPGRTAHRLVPGGFAIHGIYGRVLLGGKGFFTNDPASHPDRIGTPAGHPPLTAFLGVPLIVEGRTVGMLGLGNREGGYRDEDLAAVEALALSVVQVFVHKRSEQALRHRVEEMEKLMDLVPAAIWVSHDPDCRSIVGNQTANRFYEAMEGENVSAGPEPGKTMGPRRFFHNGRELRADELAMQEAAARNVEVRDAEYEVLLPSGGTRTILGSATPLRAADGQVRGCISSFVDITERKRGEQALRERATEIERLNVRLRRAMAETHHRVKNNLQIIAALIDMQVMRGQESIPTSELQRLGQHVAGLAAVHDVLTRSARANGDADSLSIRDALGKLRPLLAVLAGERALRFDVEDVGLPVRQGTALAVLVNELVSNAVKHGEGAIALSLAVVDGRARLTVSDEGPGFPEGFHPDRAANTGIELIQSMGRWDLQGDVAFENCPEGGARVVVTFPLMGG